MKILKVERFTGFGYHNNLVAFINNNEIKREDILNILYCGENYTLLYYAEE